MGKDNSAHNNWHFIAQTKKISVLQFVISEDDAWNQNTNQ